MLKELGLPFYKQRIWEKDLMIWMDDGAGYHMSKINAVYCCRVRLIRMDWLTQFPDLNLIKNLWQIIKVQVSTKRHRIWSLKSMKEVIKKEWEKLTKEDFWAYIESMPKRCKLVILARGVFIKYWSIYHVERSKLYHVC